MIKESRWKKFGKDILKAGSYLPGVNEVNWLFLDGKKPFSFVGRVVLSGVYGTFLFNSYQNETLDFTKWDDIEKQKTEIHSSYDSLLNKDIEDTTFVNLLNEYTPFEEKSRILERKKLENKFE